MGCLISKYLGPSYYWQLISSLIQLWSENIFCMILIILHFLSYILWIGMCSMLVTASHELEKNVCLLLLDEGSHKCQLGQSD